MVFRGTFEYSIDGRGRIPIPARFRTPFWNGAVLVKGHDGCVEVYTAEAYEKEAESFIAQRPARQMSRRLQRGFFGRSLDVELDGQGRILLPPLLRQHGSLEGSVLIVGRGECLELWNPNRWEAEEKEIDAAYEAVDKATEEGP